MLEPELNRLGAGAGGLLYLNGQFLRPEEGCIRVEDRGFLFGDGVYEALKILNGRCLWLDEHLERLGESCRAIGLEFPWAEHPLHDVLPRLAEESGIEAGLLYLQVTRGVSPRDFDYAPGLEPTVMALIRPLSFPDESTFRRGISLHPWEDFRWARCDIKSLNLLPAVLGKRAAREQGCDEVLWVAADGTVREGGSSNAFAVIDGVLRTHPADNLILNGITRQSLLRLAGELELPHEVRAFTLDELEGAEEAFVASTTRDLMPVRSVGGRTIADGRPGPVSLRLVNRLRQEAASRAGLDPPHLFSRG